MAKVESTVKRVMARDEFPYEWDVIENEWITMSDGCRLSARVWHPKTDKPVPTIFETQPYRKRDGMRGRDEPMYGRQLGSFYTEDEMKEIGKIPMTFIRAPYIDDVYGEAEILAVVDGKVVAARQGSQLATAFHPELNDDTSVHAYFVEMIKGSKAQAV